MNNYDKRWLHAFKWASKLKELFDTGNYLLVDDDDGCFNSSNTTIEIIEEERIIRIKEATCSWLIYDGNLDYDHGAYTPIKEFKKSVIDSYRLYKKELVRI